MTDAEVLRELREKLGLSVAELAAGIGFPAALLEGWEEGTTKPRAALWRALAAFIAERGIVTIETAQAAEERRLEVRERKRIEEIHARATAAKKRS